MILSEHQNNRNLFLTAKLLKQGYRYHEIRKAFSKFKYRHSELIIKYNIGLKTLLQQGISEPIFYDDLVYKFKRIVGKPNFSDQFKEIVKRYTRSTSLSQSPREWRKYFELSEVRHSQNVTSPKYSIHVEFR